MKNFLILALVLTVALVAAPAFAEDVRVAYNGVPVDLSSIGAGITAQVDDPQHLDKVSNINFDVGIEYENAVKFTDHLRLDIAGRKQINDTSFEEMWRGEAMLVYNKNFIDFSGLFGKK